MENSVSDKTEKPAYEMPAYAVKHGIPLEFFNEQQAGKKHPLCKTVGQLADALAKLPRSLPVGLSARVARSGRRVYITNIRDDETRSLEIAERD